MFASFWDRKRMLAVLQDAWVASGSRYAQAYITASASASAPPAAAELSSSKPADDTMLVPQRGDDAARERDAEPHAVPAVKAAPPPDGAATSSPNAVAPRTPSLEQLVAAANKTPEPLLSPPSPIVSSTVASVPDALPATCALRPPAPPTDDAEPLPIAHDGVGTEAALDCTPGEFFALFMADGSRFTEAFRAARGETDIEVAPWSDSNGESSVGEAACARLVTFRAPLDAMKGAISLPGIPKSTRIREEQRCVPHSMICQLLH